MARTLVLLFLSFVTLLLLLLAQHVTPTGEGEPPYCQCCVYLVEESYLTLAYQANDITVTSCTQHHKCITYCRTQLLETSEGGDLWFVTYENQTTGQYLCHFLYQRGVGRIHNKLAYGYAEMCGGPWEYVDAVSQQRLCCNEGKHVHCID